MDALEVIKESLEKEKIRLESVTSAINYYKQELQKLSVTEVVLKNSVKSLSYIIEEILNENDDDDKDDINDSTTV